MRFPDFFDDVPSLPVHDPLAAFLGASEGGNYVVHYADAVRLAGHSCPTVASAWLMGITAWQALFGRHPLERGDLRVIVGGVRGEGTAGVIGAVLQLMTGAATEDGFQGIGGQFIRKGLLTYAGEPAPTRFERISTGARVEITVRPEQATPAPDASKDRLRAVLAGQATPAEAAAFRQAWQDRVRRMLAGAEAIPELVTVTQLAPAERPDALT